MKVKNAGFWIGLLLVHGTAAAAGSDPAPSYSPYAHRDFPENVYWGDTHLHSAISADAYSYGARLGLEDAYRFARGEEVTSTTGQQARLSRPLDFLVIADHAQYLGVYQLINENNPTLRADRKGEHLYRAFKDKGIMGVFADFGGTVTSAGVESREDLGLAVKELVWQRSTETADKFNNPGKFTAMIGFEWTSMPAGNNLHRVVVFRDNGDRVRHVVPFTSAQSRNPEQLWQYLSDYEQSTGGRALAIPHNGNLSGGEMFADTTFSGEALSAGYAEKRARWEPLYEATQIKGDAEAHPLLSPDDRFADYETWDKSSLGGYSAGVDLPKVPERLKAEYARSALKKGLALQASLGVNPFKFGMVGSSDAHTSLTALEENNFFSKQVLDEPAPNRALKNEKFNFPGKTFAASGYAAVWSQENTRESLFDAMQRRETYATTGPRIMLRFFGGWNFDNLDASRPDYAAIGYKNGVPMGGDLAAAPEGRSPRFLIVAAKDPMGANLERIQVVKGWLDDEGETHEKVWDVVLSDKRTPAEKMAPPIESTVDIDTATYTNTAGEAQLATVWEDPAFDPDERAFYYVRVLEILTPRWTTYDAAFYGTDLPEGVPAIHQERAYSSPIWYTP